MNSQIDAFLTAFDDYHDAVYFSDPDHHVELVGLGQTSTLSHFNAATLQAWQEKQTVPVFGGFPFDQQPTPDSQLMNGWMLAPAYVIDLKTGTEWGTRPAPDAVSHQESGTRQLLAQQTETDWQARMQPVLETLKTDPSKQKVVLGMQEQWQLDGTLSVSQLLKTLFAQQPHTYHFCLKHQNELFLSATPERLVKLNQSHLETAAVAGSIRRGSTPTEDKQLTQKLQADSKNQREHQLVVTEIKQRLNSLINLDSTRPPTILTTPQLQHLYTPITGTLNQATTIGQLVQALHPTPALGGVPLDWALATIRNFEQRPRGLFAAPVGYVLPDGSGEFIIGIRSLWNQNSTVTFFAGAGILAASDLNAEAQEIHLKTTTMHKIIKEQIDE
ncbi:isochorismate synthase [Fructilactobacillus hinvesii]|uniref:isochorismate synthase n=1 Tax=Fructilactobacillus hinvesii TaxID=2940300 RepID=A0ABY5BSX1_9LACO|nr:isochorismate synthase [Fructilactobacillus hinvesii]USS88223.1 isochorismate synthase [Fructilactobacillus hinvesii]